MARADKKRHSGTTRKPAAIDHEPLPKGLQNVPDAEPVAMAQLAAPKAQNNPTQDAPQKQPVQDSGNKAAPANEKIAAIGGKDNSTDKDDMTSKQNSTSNMTSTPDSGKKTGSGLLAGVAGGVIAIALAGALQFSGVIPPLSNHGQAVSTGNNVATALSDSVQKELSALKAELSKLQEQGQQQLSNAISAVDKNLIEKATKTADDARATADQAQQSLSDIRQSTSAFAAQFDGLKAEIASLKENLAQNTQATISADDPQIRSLEGKLNALDESLASFKNATEQRFNGIQRDLDKAKQLESAVSQNTANIAKSNATLDSLAVEVKKIPDPLAERAKSMTTLIAANALKSAVDRGGSYVSELATFESLAPEGIALDELKKYSTTGIASNAALSEEFSSVADAIAATENQVGSDANLGQKAWSYAKGFVAIRPVGNVEGDNAGAIAARMEVAIKEADYNRALSEWQKLPQSAKDVSANFISKLKVRNDIDQLLAQLVSLTINPNAKITPQAPAQPIPAATPHETAPNHGETQP
ncbi:hypothetical protein N5853_03965 [Bartonella sp. HY329]|uniref:hypothetical protein n=1 Tax=unclassified Bartonella TaxID=2645622 RepID=UPI0021C9A1BC|nr:MULTISPECIES: hypothetical protein [unclassified Bartonella]UXM95791.1 hypothetical protein N5853_03965 [Bartonella sp. HY329]UXN10116.1 hypothetical protein N5852_03975 [Bartonella sp. HY328]